MSQLSQVSRIAPWGCFLRLVGRWVGRFFGQVMSPHHSDQMSQRLQVSRIDAVSEKRLSEHIKMIHKAPVLPVTPKSGPEKLRSQGWSSTGSLNCSPILPNTRLETCRNCEAIFSPGHQCSESGKLDKTEPEPISKPPYPNERIYYQPCKNYGKSCFEKNSGCTKIPGGTDIYCGPCFQLLWKEQSALLASFYLWFNWSM